MKNKKELPLSGEEKQLLDAILSVELHPYGNKEEEIISISMKIGLKNVR